MRARSSTSKSQRDLNGTRKISLATSHAKIFAPHCVSHTGAPSVRLMSHFANAPASPRATERRMSVPRCGQREPITALSGPCYSNARMNDGISPSGVARSASQKPTQSAPE